MTPKEITRELRGSIRSPKGLCDALGYESKKASGEGVVVRCPFHAENTPSCSVRVASDRTIGFKCFSCGEGGDALKLIANAYGLSTKGKPFFEVLRKASAIANRWDLLDELDKGSNAKARPVESGGPRLSVPVVVEKAGSGISNARFHEIASWLLERCPLEGDVLEYCYRRKVGAHAAAFCCGALPVVWKPVFDAMVFEFGIDDVQRSGLLSDKGRFIPSNHRFMVPWCDGTGQIETIECCRIVNGTGAKRLFLKGRGPRAPFGVNFREEPFASGELIICEGSIDTWSRRRHVLRSGDGSQVLGAASVTIRFDEAFRELTRDRDVVISFDADEAGDAGAKKLASALIFARSITREVPRAFNDVNELVCSLEVA